MPKEQDGKYILLGNVGMFSQHCGFSPKHDTKKVQDVNDNYWETWYVQSILWLVSLAECSCSWLHFHSN